MLDGTDHRTFTSLLKALLVLTSPGWRQSSVFHTQVRIGGLALFFERDLRIILSSLRVGVG